LKAGHDVAGEHAPQRAFIGPVLSAGRPIHNLFVNKNMTEGAAVVERVPPTTAKPSQGGTEANRQGSESELSG
jgi:hypothetical protein